MGFKSIESQEQIGSITLKLGEPPTTRPTLAPTTEAGHDHTPECECLPIRVVVDQHGHYWRDYGDHWSMCPVSDENVATDPVTEFFRIGIGGDFEIDPASIETEAREALAAELAARDAALGEMDDAAEEYINAVVAYLDPENQYTESRLDAMRIAVSDLIVAIQRRRLDVIATPFAAREGPPDGA
jgi:hypothetical protein